jgi:hypothetical protein
VKSLITKHWGLSFDHEWQESGELPSFLEKEDRSAACALRLIESRTGMKWLLEGLNYLPEDEQVILCKVYGLRGHEAQSYQSLGISYGTLDSALGRLKTAVGYAMQGKKRGPKKITRRRPYRSLRRRMLDVEKLLGERGAMTSAEIAAALDTPDYVTFQPLSVLRKEGRVRVAGRRRSCGTTNLYALAENTLTSPNKRGLDTGSEAA